jgi:hypothetical protein
VPPAKIPAARAKVARMNVNWTLNVGLGWVVVWWLDSRFVSGGGRLMGLKLRFGQSSLVEERKRRKGKEICFIEPRSRDCGKRVEKKLLRGRVFAAFYSR